MRPRALLVTFDAWRTLFFPSEPVAAQYTRLARQHGMKVEESDVRDGFRKGTLPLDCVAAASTGEPVEPATLLLAGRFCAERMRRDLIMFCYITSPGRSLRGDCPSLTWCNCQGTQRGFEMSGSSLFVDRCTFLVAMAYPLFTGMSVVAFKTMSSKYPNYGKSFGMKPEQWWTEVSSRFSQIKTVLTFLIPAHDCHLRT